MRVHLSRPRWPAAFVAAAVAPLVLTALLAVPPASAGPGVPATAVGRPVLLIDGTALYARRLAGGGHAVIVRPGTRQDSLLALGIGHHIQEIPAAALPYLGHGLDPSLFDLSALRRAEARGVLPVRVVFRGRAPRLPGITITRSRPGSEQGYLTAAGAVAFGAALFRQLRADHVRGSYGHDGMFAGGVDIALAGTRVLAARPARPRFRLHTLTMAATNRAGRPDTGDAVFVLNADNPARFADPFETFNVFDHGIAKFSVPAGHYWAIGDFLSFTGNNVGERLAVLPQFTVRGSRTVRMSERSASSEIGFTTPRPATLQLSSFTMVRGAPNGTTFTFGFLDSGLSLWVSPTSRKPTVGTLHTFTGGQLTSSRNGTNAAYAYNLNYAGPDGIIPAQQHYDATPASLAKVTDHYFQDVRSHAFWGVFGGFPAELVALFAVGYQFSPPTRQVQYFTANPSLAWSAFYQEFGSFSVFGAGQSDAFRVFAGGQRLAEDWNAYPLHPQPAVQFLRGVMGKALPVLPSASRRGNVLTLAPAPFSDNYPGHSGNGVFSFSSGRALVAGSYAIYQNGVKIAHGNPLNGIKPVQLSPRRSAITFVLSEARADTKFPLSTATTTSWTWRSARQPGATVPPNWFCGFSRRFTLLHGCAVQPMMTLNYHVRGLPLDGRTPAGPQVIDLAVRHIPLATPAPITGATVQVSYNDGQTFQPTAVTSAGAGRFLISFTAPAGVDVTLRVSATDAAGGSINETIMRAYGVAS